MGLTYSEYVDEQRRAIRNKTVTNFLRISKIRIRASLKEDLVPFGKTQSLETTGIIDMEESINARCPPLPLSPGSDRFRPDTRQDEREWKSRKYHQPFLIGAGEVPISGQPQIALRDQHPQLPYGIGCNASRI